MSGVRWIKPGAPISGPPALSGSQDLKRADRASALIVVTLTFACTLLSLYDLYLLASNA